MPNICPICGTEMKVMAVSCPDGNPGCLVYHSKIACPYECAHEIILISYYNGIKDGVRRFAWWKDGIQYVGTCGNTLANALKEIEDKCNLRLKEVKS